MSDIYAKMGKNLIGTKTFDNLMEAFAGESQARNKYTYFASQARKDGYVQIAKIFEETAANEKEHAKIWYKILEGVHGTKDNLEIAAEGEQYENWEVMQPASKTLMEARGYYNNYRGVLADGTIVRGRVHMALLGNNQLLTLHMSCPGWYNSSYMKVFDQIRDTLKPIGQ